MGCIHGENGCSDGVFYGKLIKSYTYKNIKYEGMPKFIDIQTMYNLFPSLKLEWQCMCYISNCESCEKAHYPEKTSPQDYDGICSKLHCILCNENLNFKNKCLKCQDVLILLLNNYFNDDISNLIFMMNKYSYYK